MTSSQAVREAASLLQTRLAEARTEMTRLAEEVAQIEGALERLGFGPSSAPQPVEEEPQAEESPFRPNMPVAAAVKALLETEEGPWTPRSAGERLKEIVPALQGDRTSEKYYNTVGAAFYHMRRRNEAFTDRYNFTRAVKWARDAEAPAATGASDGEESSEGSSGEIGGPANGAEPPGRDRDPDDAGLDHGHGDRAALVAVRSE